MKINVRIITSIAFLILIALFVNSKVLNESKENEVVDQNIGQNISTPPEVSSKTEAPIEKYIALIPSLISEHNKSDDCWLFIDDSVYNVTNFLKNHSGGPDKILPYCGKDATTAFKSRIHSAGAKMLLKRLYLGKLNEKVLISEVQKVKNDDLTSPNQ